MYRYLVERELTARWWATSRGTSRTGGVYRVKVRGDLVRGEFVEVEPGRRVVYTWGWEGADQVHAPGTTTVEWTSSRRRRDARPPAPHRADRRRGGKHGEGWGQFLPVLAKAAAA